jgi:hypothetical protein
LLIPLSVISQSIDALDYISPFHNGFAAIKKDNQWAFINTKGDIVVNYRTDLVLSTFDDGDYPVFANERCLIIKEQNGISYFGYIDSSGETVIEPQYLNATNFYQERAIALELLKVVIGRSETLDKDVAYDKYLEAIIDTNGNVLEYLSPKRTNVILDKKFLPRPPEIKSKQISNHLYAISNEDYTWTIVKRNQ